MPAPVSAYHPTAPVSSRFTVHSSLAGISTFSAKERDTETGLSYFGSRYYSSDLSLWLSVDPMSGKYPSLSPYTYCANNPVKLVDPNGEEIVLNRIKRRTTRRIMKQYLTEQFGTFNMFRFSGYGNVVINKRHFDSFFKSANPNQQKLLSGMKSAIESDMLYNVRITDKPDKIVKMTHLYDSGLFDSEGFPMRNTYSRNLDVEVTGGGLTVYEVNFNMCFICISTDLAEKALLSTDLVTVGGTTTDEYYPIYTSSANACFFHELLDEGLNYYDKKTTNDTSPQMDKVQYQNAAFKNLHKTERNGMDHE